jgi:hypothetical protein
VHAHFVGMLVGGLSSLLLQALHPRALAAVWDHSNFRHNLKGRLGRTAYFVAITTYGGRDDAIKAMQVALNRGMAQRFILETPLMWIDKAQTWSLAEAMGGAALVDLILRETHTCYVGERGALHAWGHGCGVCPACQLRADGFARYRAVQSG